MQFVFSTRQKSKQLEIWEYDEDGELISVPPQTSEAFKKLSQKNIRQNLNKILYWNHYLLNKKKMKICHKKVSKK